jgi:hypothetical protein
VITPVHTNAVTLTYSSFDGDILFDPTIPITNVTSHTSISSVSLFHAFSLFGRSSSITAALPYGVGHFQGLVTGAPTETTIYRSGIGDAVFRFSVDLIGGGAMGVSEYAKWKHKTLMGVSFKLVKPPTGQYDPTKLVNLGSNRWAYKPEIGFSRRWGNWVFDTYEAIWLVASNPEFLSHNVLSPGRNVKEESHVGAVEGHISYNVSPAPGLRLIRTYGPLAA